MLLKKELKNLKKLIQKWVNKIYNKYIIMNNHTKIKILNNLKLGITNVLGHFSKIIDSPTSASSFGWLESIVVATMIIAFIMVLFKRKNLIKKIAFTIVALISVSYLQAFVLLFYIFNSQSNSLFHIINWLLNEIELKFYEYKPESEFIKLDFNESKGKIKLQTILIKIFGARAPNFSLS